jgi:OmpA-OmpF porin, OOP family
MNHFCSFAIFFVLWGFVAPKASAQATAPKSENLGPQVNSTYNEINPVISPDGRTLYFSRISHPQNTEGDKGSQDIWYSDLDEARKQWGPARRMPNPLNAKKYNCLYSITPDGNTIIIKGAYNNGVYETRGFSMSKKVATGWGSPQKLNIANYERMSVGEYGCGFMSADGKTLLMAFSEKKNSKEDNIYVSFRMKDGSWSKPLDLGPDINTKFTETTPFLAPDGVTLYFSSDRDGGQGSNDVWVSKRIDKTWKRWSRPQNLGPAVNTDGYDAYYTLSAAGDFAYLTTFKNTLGKGDIVRINLAETTPPPTLADNNDPAKAGSGKNGNDPNNPNGTDQTRPNPIALISGRVIDPKTGKPVAARIIYQTLPDGAEVGEANSDPNTGEYKIALPYGQKYAIRPVSPNFIAEGDNIDLTDKTKGYQEIKGKDLKLIPIEIDGIVRLNNIFFDLGKADLRPESAPELDRMVTTLNDLPKLVIEIGGHTDNTGGNAINAKLSQDRADAVREYFISKGIEPDRVASKGYGETKPVAANDTEAGRQQNRRVEFLIVKK